MQYNYLFPFTDYLTKYSKFFSMILIGGKHNVFQKETTEKLITVCDIRTIGDNYNMENDIALLKFCKPIEITPQIQPISVGPSKACLSRTGTAGSMYIAGWGRFDLHDGKLQVKHVGNDFTLFDVEKKQIYLHSSQEKKDRTSGTIFTNLIPNHVLHIAHVVSDITRFSDIIQYLFPNIENLDALEPGDSGSPMVWYDEECQEINQVWFNI